MGTVVDLQHHRKEKREPQGSRFVYCAYCRERHPVVRLPDGTHRCPTAFADSGRWFCRNRGCRAAWLSKQPTRR